MAILPDVWRYRVNVAHNCSDQETQSANSLFIHFIYSLASRWYQDGWQVATGSGAWDASWCNWCWRRASLWVLSSVNAPIGVNEEGEVHYSTTAEDGAVGEWYHDEDLFTLEDSPRRSPMLRFNHQRGSPPGFHFFLVFGLLLLRWRQARGHKLFPASRCT